MKNGWEKLGTFRVINYAKDTIFDDTMFLLEIIDPYVYNYGREAYVSDFMDVSDGASIPDELEKFAGSNFQVEDMQGIKGKSKKERLIYILNKLKTDREFLKVFIKHINQRGSYVPAAFIHDKLCKLGLDGCPVCSWEDAHKIFYHAMLDNGVPKFKGFFGLGGALAKYQAVRFGMMFKRWDYEESNCQ